MKKDQFKISIEGNNKNSSSINLKNSSELLKFLQNYKFNSDEKLIIKENFSNKGALVENESQKHKLISDFWAKELSKKSDLSLGMTYSKIDEKQAEAYRNYEIFSIKLGISETPFIDNEKFISASQNNFQKVLEQNFSQNDFEKIYFKYLNASKSNNPSDLLKADDYMEAKMKDENPKLFEDFKQYFLESVSAQKEQISNISNGERFNDGYEKEREDASEGFLLNDLAIENGNIGLGAEAGFKVATEEKISEIISGKYEETSNFADTLIEDIENKNGSLWEKKEKINSITLENFSYNKEDVALTLAENLPQGWTWRDFDDESGSILNRNGRPVYNYDLISQVYKSANSKEWIPMNTLNKGEPITLKEFKNHIENIISKKELINNINPQIMEQSTEKVKLRIDLPNNEKPFYNRLTSVESANQKIKEASESLNNKNSMTVSINGTPYNLSKKEVKNFSVENFITPAKEAQKTEKEPLFNVLYAKADVSGDEAKILDKKEIKEVNLNEAQSFIKENLKDSNNLTKDESIKLEIISNNGFKQTSYIDLENSKKDFAKNFQSNYSDFKTEENAKIEVQNLISKMSESQKQTFSYLNNSLKFLGFGEKAAMQKEVAAAIVSQQENFSIAHKSDKGYFKNNDINFNINFQKSNTSDKVFLNSFDVNLKNEKRNVDISQNFNVSKFGFTEKEAVNLMEGRSVKTDLKLKSGETEKNVFIKLDFNEKEENGNFKTKKFFEKYGVDTSKILEKNNAFFKDDEVKNKVIKALEKGNVVPLIVKNSENKLQNFNAILSPESKSLHLYNNRMERVNVTETISNSAKVEQNTTEHTSQYKNKLKP